MHLKGKFISFVLNRKLRNILPKRFKNKNPLKEMLAFYYPKRCRAEMLQRKKKQAKAK